MTEVLPVPGAAANELSSPSAEPVAPRPPSARASSPRRSASEAWADLRTTGSAASATSFCQSVSSWIEGASAQLGRQQWPIGAKRPGIMEVQAQLRQALALVTDEADYVKALELARRHVALQLSKERARAIAAG